MDREQLMTQVKEEYARLTDLTTKESFVGETNTAISNEIYYENLLQDVLHAIQEGRFDDFESGKDIVEAVANNKECMYSGRSDEKGVR